MVCQARETLEDPVKKEAYDAELTGQRRQEAPRSRASVEPLYTGHLVIFTVARRYALDPWRVEMQEMQIRQQRTLLGIYENPGHLGTSWILRPDLSVAPAYFHGYLKSMGISYAAVAQVEGDTAALSLTLNGRLFTTEDAARRVRAAM